MKVTTKNVVLTSAMSLLLLIQAANIKAQDFSQVMPSFSGVPSQPLSINRIDNTPRGFTFSADGTTLYVAGGQGDQIIQYNLSTAFDLLTASFRGNFLVSTQTTDPRDVAISNDGSKMYVIDPTADKIFQYTLSTPFLVTSASYDNVEFSVASEETTAMSLTFTADGLTMYVMGQAGQDTNQYTLSTAFDLSTASYTKKSPDLITTGTGDGFTISADGAYLFSLNTHFLSRKILRYTLSTPFDVSTASSTSLESETYDYSNEDESAEDIAFSTDGLKMFILGNQHNDINEYTLTTPYDLSTVSFKPVYGNPYSIREEFSFAVGLDFSSDGKKMFVTSVNENRVFEYALDVPFDVKTALATGNEYNFSSGGDARVFRFSTDGMKMYTAGHGTIYEYSLTTAYDITTGTFSDSFSTSTQETSPTDIAFSTDGLKMFVVGTGGDRIFQYNMTTGFDLTTVSYSGISHDPTAQEWSLSGICFSKDGMKMFVSGWGSLRVHQYDLSSPFAIAGGVSYNMNNRFTTTGQTASPRTVRFSNEDLTNASGVKMYLVDNGSGWVIQYVMDEVAPTITSASTATFQENGTGTVYTATANETSTITLGSTKDEALFSISNGIISFNNSPDFENPSDGNSDNNYLIDLIATDESGNASTTELSISVSDIDDTAPNITSATSLSAAENISGTIYTATADETVTFTLGNSKDEGQFTLSTAAISFTAAPDFETPTDSNKDNKYLIDLIATDASGNASTAEITITITDVDETKVTLGLDEVVGFSIYPNPVANQITITGFENERIDQVKVVDLNGALVRQFEEVQHHVYNVADLQSGIYLLIINRSGEDISAGKFVKQ